MVASRWTAAIFLRDHTYYDEKFRNLVSILCYIPVKVEIDGSVQNLIDYLLILFVRFAV